MTFLTRETLFAWAHTLVSLLDRPPLSCPLPQAYLEINNTSSIHSFGGGGGTAHHLDASSASLKQLSFCRSSSPSWAVAGGRAEPSPYGGAGPERDGEVIFEGFDGDTTASSPPPPGRRQRQRHASSGGQAKHWGLWHEGEGVDGGGDGDDGGNAYAPRGDSSGFEVDNYE